MERTIQKQVMVRDGHVSVDVYGAGDAPAVLVIPGVLADAAAWGEVARHLTGWATVAVLDRRGRRPSTALPQGYTLGTEVEDARTVLRELGEVRTVVGWSYGGLVALHLADVVPVPHVIAYEPVMAPFGAQALPHLVRVRDDADARVEVALREVARMSDDEIRSLRSHDAAWSELRRLGAPVPAETRAINEAGRPEKLATAAGRVDLVVGERNRGQAPYGTSFDDVARRVPGAQVHELAGQGHLAHLEAPGALADLVSALGGREPGPGAGSKSRGRG